MTSEDIHWWTEREEKKNVWEVMKGRGKRKTTTRNEWKIVVRMVKVKMFTAKFGKIQKCLSPKQLILFVTTTSAPNIFLSLLYIILFRIIIKERSKKEEEKKKFGTPGK